MQLFNYYYQSLSYFINHVLRQNDWAIQKLILLSRTQIRVDATPFSCNLLVDETGHVTVTDKQDIYDVVIQTTPANVLQALTKRSFDAHLFSVTGNSASAMVIAEILTHARWDIEEDLSKLIGDILAHQVVMTGNKFVRWPGLALTSIASAFTEYWTEEQPLLAKANHVQRYIEDVDELRDAAELLAKRIHRLSAAKPI